MNHKRRYSSWLLILLVGCIGISVIALSRGCSCLDGESDKYFNLPPTAQSVEKHSLVLSRSCTLWIKFHIPPSDLNAFISTTFIKDELSTTLLPTSIGGIAYLEQKTGWDLNSINSHLSGEASGEGNTYLDEQFVFVDTTNPAQYTVYLVTKKNWL